MDRLESNRKLLDILKETIENNPDLRFIQALWACKFIDANEVEPNKWEIVDRFNEEPDETISRLSSKEVIKKKIETFEDSDDLFLCECHNMEHQIIFTYFKDVDEVFMNVHLCPDTFWGRLKKGIKYIFGHRSMYGEFDEFVLKKKDVDKLQKIVNFLRK